MQNTEGYDLNKPAFAKLPENSDEKTEEPKEEVQEAEEGTADTSVEENKVPYSRFKNVHSNWRESERARAEAEARAEARERELEELRSQRTERRETGEMPLWWKELYGDGENAQRGWKVYSENQPTLSREEIREEAIRAYQEEQRLESRRFETNVKTIDENLEDLSVAVGRDLTEAEQAAILEIQDEFTPTDEDGMYIGPLFSAEKAWQIYELQQESQKNPRRRARNEAAEAIGAGSNGEPGSKTTDEKWDSSRLQNFGGWRNRIK